MYIDARCDYDLIFIGSFASLLFSPAAIEMHKPSTAHVMNTRNKVFKYQKKMRAAWKLNTPRRSTAKDRRPQARKTFHSKKVD
jgi:hypothetical protein